MKTTQDIIIRPLITERAAVMKEAHNKVVFQVAVDANKNEIKKAVEYFQKAYEIDPFGVTVLAIRTMNVKGKPKRMGRFEGRRAAWKKAIVTLSEEDTLDFFEGA